MKAAVSTSRDSSLSRLMERQKPNSLPFVPKTPPQAQIIDDEDTWGFVETPLRFTYRGRDIAIYRKDYSSIRDNAMLTSAAVDTCVDLMQTRSKLAPRTMIIDTSLATALQDAGAKRDAMKATDLVRSHKLVNATILIGPIHDGAEHWAAGRMESYGSSELYNSLGTHGNDELMLNIADMVIAMKMALPSGDEADPAEVEARPCPQQQPESLDCGLFSAAVIHTLGTHGFVSISTNSPLLKQLQRETIIADMVVNHPPHAGTQSSNQLAASTKQLAPMRVDNW